MANFKSGELFKHLLHATVHPQFLVLELQLPMAACWDGMVLYIIADMKNIQHALANLHSCQTHKL